MDRTGRPTARSTYDGHAGPVELEACAEEEREVRSYQDTWDDELGPKRSERLQASSQVSRRLLGCGMRTPVSWKKRSRARHCGPGIHAAPTRLTMAAQTQALLASKRKGKGGAAQVRKGRGGRARQYWILGRAATGFKSAHRNFRTAFFLLAWWESFDCRLGGSLEISIAHSPAGRASAVVGSTALP